MNSVYVVNLNTAQRLKQKKTGSFEYQFQVESTKVPLSDELAHKNKFTKEMVKDYTTQIVKCYKFLYEKGIKNNFLQMDRIILNQKQQKIKLLKYGLSG